MGRAAAGRVPDPFKGERRRVNRAAVPSPLPNLGPACRSRSPCYAPGMHDERAQEALTRIEQALDRLERAATPSAEAAAAADELGRLRAAHAQLRERVRGAIGEIDGLLAGRSGTVG